MFLRYGIKARVQSQSANAQGVADAGTLGASNAARAANLAHISDELDLARSRRIAAREFGGEVEVAAEGSYWEV